MSKLIILLLLAVGLPHENDCWITQDPPYENPKITMKQEQISFVECVKIVKKVFEAKNMNSEDFNKIHSLIYNSPNRKEERKKYGIIELNASRINDIIYCRLKKVTKPEEKKEAIELLLKLISAEMTNKRFVTIDQTDYGNPPWYRWWFSSLDTLSVIGDISIVPRLKDIFTTAPEILPVIFKKTVKKLGGEITQSDIDMRKDFLKKKFPQAPKNWNNY